MSFNGSGTFLINTAGQPVVSGTVISSTAFNALTADLATGLSTAITKDGQTTVTANIPMSTYKFTGLGVGSAATDSANLSQVQSTVTKLLTSVSGTDTITAVGAPVVAAYAAGQMFYFVATGDNTGAVTLNIDSLGAKAVTRDGSVALAAGDIKSGEVVVVVYDGTRFQVVSQLNSAGDARFANVSIASSLYVGGVSTFVGNAGFSANVSIASALSVGGVAAITGATTIGGNLTLNGGTANGVLYLNNSKVATSGSALTFDGTKLVASGGNEAIRIASGAPYYSFYNAAQSTQLGYIQHTGTDLALVNVQNGTMPFYVNNAEGMRLTSTGLGIGTSSPGSKLEISASNPVFTIYNTNTGDNGITWESDAAAGASRASLFLNYANAELRMTAGAGGGSYFQSFYTNGTERARITSGGDLLVGTTTTLAKLTVEQGAANANGAQITNQTYDYQTLGLHNKATANDNLWVVFGTEASFTTRGSIDYNRAGGLTRYNTTSDYRAKDILGTVQNSGATIDALKVYEGQMKGATQSRPMLIAHEAQEYAPYAVSGVKDEVNDDGTPKYQQMDVSALVPLLLAEIQSLRARVAQLESK